MTRKDPLLRGKPDEIWGAAWMSCPHILSLPFFSLATTVDPGDRILNALPRPEYGLVQCFHLFLLYELL